MIRHEMTELILIRHGETEHNAAGRFQGHLDTALSEKGHVQVQKMAQRFASMTVSALYSSDLLRARQTAQPIAEVAGLSMHTDRRLRERNVGVFSDLTRAEVREKYPEAYEKFAQRDPHFRLPEGESSHEMFARVLHALEEIAANHAGERVVVVTHGGPIMALLRHTLQIRYDGKRRFSNHNTSLNIFRHHAGDWQLMTWGDIAHLRNDLPPEMDI